ncbi:hypothetical protein [Nostoc favosum]|uniref:hypothetical protein n=1 Tax=Nostoc favosum TaxID=2907819 RepID=UPI001E5F6115|nr:hypothetical protein [Nostoc favosum]
MDIGRREGFRLRCGYRYANASSFIPGNPSTGLAHRFASMLKKLTLTKILAFISASEVYLWAGDDANRECCKISVFVDFDIILYSSCKWLFSRTIKCYIFIAFTEN